MQSHSPALFKPAVEQKPIDLPAKKQLTILEPFVEKWTSEFKKFEAIYKTDALEEEKKKDYDMYQQHMSILFQKSNYFLQGITDLKTAPDNAKKIDELSRLEKQLLEKQFTIVGPITRDFSTIYLKYLEEFINLKFSKIEKTTIFAFAKAYRFQTISRRKKDAKENKLMLEIKIQQYDNVLKSQLQLKKSP